MSTSRCKVSPDGKHVRVPVENGELVRSEHLGADVARWHECQWCGDRIELEGRWAVEPRARR